MIITIFRTLHADLGGNWLGGVDIVVRWSYAGSLWSEVCHGGG